MTKMKKFSDGKSVVIEWECEPVEDSESQPEWFNRRRFKPVPPRRRSVDTVYSFEIKGIYGERKA